MRAFQARRGSCPGEADEELHQPASLPCLNACEARGEVLHVFGILVSRHWLFCKPLARKTPQATKSHFRCSCPRTDFAPRPLCEDFHHVQQWLPVVAKQSKQLAMHLLIAPSPQMLNVAFLLVGTRSKVRTHLDQYTIAPLILLHLRPRRSGPPWTNRSSSRAAHPSVRARPGAWCHLWPYPFL